MAIYKCKMCGAQLEVQSGETVATCAYCGSKQTVANADDERKENLFNRANALRANCEFDKALLAYQSILSIFPHEPEAHWGITLCRYGIEYVDDPATRTKKPTIHRVSYESILKDSDYLSAVSYADVVAREVYQEQAQGIADIQKNFLSISQKEEPFDIFICYKETDENGRRTPDSVIAQEIYSALTDNGYKVFFARITLENKLGVMYEPYIFAALNSAKIMLVIGTKKSYFEAVWVQNEWSRFFDLMKTRPDRYLIPCYRDMNAYDMPEQFLSLQAQDLSRLGFLQDLMRGVNKIMGRDTSKPTQQAAKIIQTDVNVDALLTRAEILIGDQAFDKADALLERALNNDPKNSQAYLLKLLIELRISSVEDLKNHKSDLWGNSNFKKAYDFGDAAQKDRLSAINEEIHRRCEEAQLQGIYNKGLEYLRSKDFVTAQKMFASISNYRDAAARANECGRLEKESIYDRASAYKNSDQYDAAISLFSKIKGFKDSEQQIAECTELNKQATYLRACNLRDSRKFDEAIANFKRIPGYRDSEAQATLCEKLKADAEKESIYVKCVFDHKIDPRAEEKRLREACAGLAKIPGYKDADQLLVQYEGILKEYEAQLAKEREERARERARKIKKAKKIALISGSGALVLTGALLLTLLFFVPEGKQNKAKELIDAGKYDEAIAVLEGNGSYGETAKLKTMVNAGKSFEEKDYETGIKYIYNIGGRIDVSYDANGGTAGSSSETIVQKAYIQNQAEKSGYVFHGWVLDAYSIKSSDFYASITLKAEYQIITYVLTYDLGGGHAENLPRNYDTEKTVTLPNPTRKGYTFLGWTTLGLDEPQLNYVLPAGSTGDKEFTANWKANEYFIHLDPAGGTVSTNVVKVTFDQTYQLPEPTYTAYAFQGWYDKDSNKYPAGRYDLAEDLFVTAKWQIVQYTITYNLNGGTNHPSNPSSYTIDDSVTFAAPKKTGYTFLGWFDGDGNQIQSIPSGTMGELTLTARWNEGDPFVVTLDPNGGDVTQTSVNVQYDHNYSLPDATRPGYSFNGWYDGTDKVDGTGVWKFAYDKTLVADWEIINYPIAYTLNGGTNNSSNPSSYTVEDSVTFAAPKKPGYAFLGWYNGEQNVTSVPKGSVGAINLEAKWSPDLHNLSVTSQNTSKGRVEITSGSGYSDESITVTATPVGDCVFKGWYHDSTKISDDAIYTFIMPLNDYSLTARFWTKTENDEWNVAHGVTPSLVNDGQAISYGMYPQENVNDVTTVAALEAAEAPEPNGWYLYKDEYYAKLCATPYDAKRVFDNGTTIVSGQTYWFKCGPIIWDVISNENGDYFAVSSLVLERRWYNEDYSGTKDGHYPNNYMYSEIRSWLNGEFLSTAFYLGDSQIETTAVDNSVGTTGSSYSELCCETTNDKVFLLSYREMLRLEDVKCKSSDYAVAQGIFRDSAYNDYVSWYTRSPYRSAKNEPNCVRYIHSSGLKGYSNYVDRVYGVRPAMHLKID